MLARWFGLGLVAGCLCVAGTGWSQNLEVTTAWNKDIPSGSPASDQDDTDWFSVPVDGELMRLLALHNTDLSTTLTISAFVFSDNVNFETRSSDNIMTVPPGEYNYITVYFNPKSAGQKTCTLTIPSDDPGSPYVINLSGNAVVGAAPIVPDLAVARGKAPKAKKNKTTGLLDVKWSVPVENSGTDTATTPTLNIYLSNTAILGANPTVVQSIPMKPLAAGKNGKPKKKNVKVKLSGVANLDTFIYGEIVAEGQPNLKSHVNGLFDSFPAAP